MTLRELQNLILNICPDAQFDEMGDGQVLCYTGHIVDEEEDWLVGDMPLRSFDD